jgi:hypothetical protein
MRAPKQRRGVVVRKRIAAYTRADRVGFVASQLPPLEDIVDLPSDELGLRLLRLVLEHNQGHLLSRSVVANQSYWSQEIGPEGTSREFIEAMADAWDWLVFNRLVAMDPDSGSLNGHAYVTRRGRTIAADPRSREFLRSEARLALDLHPSRATRTRRLFHQGD